MTQVQVWTDLLTEIYLLHAFVRVWSHPIYSRINTAAAAAVTSGPYPWTTMAPTHKSTQWSHGHEPNHRVREVPARKSPL